MDLPEENNTAQENVDADTAVSASSADAVKEAVVEKSADAVEETVVEKTEEEKKAELAANGGLEELSPERAALPWYAIHTYAGFEGRVKLSLEERIRSEGLQEKFGNVLVPQETVVELSKGQKKTSMRKLFPSYIMVQLHLDEDTWHVVNSTPKVTGFVGDARNPVPLTSDEVTKLVEQIKGGGERAKPKVSFETGEAIKVIDGPFADFNGTVDDVKPDKGKLRVLISIFGRNTPVELDFVQVEKV